MIDAVEIIRLTAADAGEALTLLRAAYVTEAQRYQDPNLPPLTQPLSELTTALAASEVIALGIRDAGRLVAAVQLRIDGPVAHLGRLVVAPDRQGQGLGSTLLRACEDALPGEVEQIRIFTGSRSEPTIRLYERFGYRPTRITHASTHDVVHMAKALRPPGAPGPGGAGSP